MSLGLLNSADPSSPLRARPGGEAGLLGRLQDPHDEDQADDLSQEGSDPELPSSYMKI